MQQNINNSYLYSQQPNFQSYQKPQETIADGAKKIEQSNVGQMAQNINMPAVVGGGVAAGGVLLWLTSLLNKQLQGDYDKTFFGKIEKAGNDFGAKSSVSQICSGASKALKWIKNNIVEKSEILRSIAHKPSMGGPQVQSQQAGTLGHLSNYARKVMETYDKVHGTTEFKTILENTAKEPHKYADDLYRAIEAFGKKNPNGLKEVLKCGETWLPVPKFLNFIEKKGSLAEVLNKIKLTKNYKTLSSPLGAKTAGILFRSLEACSNGMTGGKLAVMLQAAFIGQSIYEGMEAPKGERFKKFAESLASFMAIMLTMGIQLKAYNAAAGMKFIGMSAENYKKYHALIENINGAASTGDTAAYNLLKGRLKDIIKDSNKNTRFWQKPFKWIGNALSWGRIKETIKPCANASATGVAKGFDRALHSLKLGGYGAKVGAGYVGRFLLIGFGVMSIFSGLAAKASHLIFGKPNIPEEKTPEAVSAEVQQPVTKQPELQPQTQTPPMINPNLHYKEGDLLNTLKNKPQTNSNAVGAQTLGAQKINNNDNNATEVKRTYIPNPVLGPEEEISPAEARSARIDKIMHQADLAEAQAQKFLNAV